MGSLEFDFACRCLLELEGEQIVAFLQVFEKVAKLARINALLLRQARRGLLLHMDGRAWRVGNEVGLLNRTGIVGGGNDLYSYGGVCWSLASRELGPGWRLEMCGGSTWLEGAWWMI